MCISRRNLDWLDVSNEHDYKSGLMGSETYERFVDHALQCRQCELLDNGEHGDIEDECRTRILRIFVSGRHDDALRLAKRREDADAGRGEE